jgi:hypothetical protein
MNNGAEGSATRRTLARAAVGTAWTAPLVMSSRPAPALAASPYALGRLSIVRAEYWWFSYVEDATYWGVVPSITVRNDGATTTTQAEVTLEFPATFEGTRLDPPRPDILNYHGDDGWDVSTPRRSSADEPSQVVFTRLAAQLAPGEVSTIGNWFPTYNPYAIVWQHKVADTVSVSAAAAGYDPTYGVLIEVAKPT